MSDIVKINSYSVKDKIARELLETKLNKPTENGTVGQVLALDVGGNTVWKTGSAGTGSKSITDCTINADGHLIITYSDSTTQDCGKVVGANGVNGIDGKDGASGVPPVIAMTDTTAQLEPNNMYIWGEVTSLNITLTAPTDNTRLNEYMLQFACGDTAAAVTLPSAIKWITETNIEPNKTYQISIINNLAVMGGA